jgi:hypothetical protein
MVLNDYKEMKDLIDKLKLNMFEENKKINFVKDEIENLQKDIILNDKIGFFDKHRKISEKIPLILSSIKKLDIELIKKHYDYDELKKINFKEKITQIENLTNELKKIVYQLEQESKKQEDFTTKLQNINNQITLILGILERIIGSINNLVASLDNIKFYLIELQNDNNLLLNKNEIKEGVDFVFQKNPELANAVYDSIQIDKSLYNKNINNVGDSEFITLYRAEGETTNKENLPIAVRGGAGSWFTPNIIEAIRYKLKDRSRIIYKIDIPKQLYDNILIARKDILEMSKGEVQLPPSISKLKIDIEQQAKQIYSKYLDTIFPDSKFKDIVYHGGKLHDKNHYFSKSLTYAKRYGDQLIISLLNIKNPEYTSNILKSGNIIRGEPKNILPSFLNYSKKIFVPLDKDSVINNVHEEIVVFELSQIHILGSKQDIENFKKFVKK